MTTTLRPTGPEERSADGGRVRSYDVCVNSRAVGSVQLAMGQQDGPAVGRVVALHVDREARRRGRATVAALAAEEILRSWGCARMEVGVPAEAEGALRLAEALGYVERHRQLVKTLVRPPALPPGSADRAMDAGESAAWLARWRAQPSGGSPEYAVAPVPGRSTTFDSWAGVRDSDGHVGAATTLRVLTHQGLEVGTLGAALPSTAPQRPGCWVLHVEVEPGHRGRGHGRTLLLVAERECLAAGHQTLSAEVRADHVPAARVCAALGYRVTVRHLYKPLV